MLPVVARPCLSGLSEGKLELPDSCSVLPQVQLCLEQISQS